MPMLRQHVIKFRTNVIYAHSSAVTTGTEPGGGGGHSSLKLWKGFKHGVHPCLERNGQF